MSRFRRQLQEELDLAIRERDAARLLVKKAIENGQRDLQAVQRGHGEEMRAMRDDLHVERSQRMAAQRGLVPYVRSLEALDTWLLEQPSLRAQLEPILRQLGLWEIRLGYDPDKDLSLSAIWGGGAKRDLKTQVIPPE
jgi:hypothetical protein